MTIYSQIKSILMRSHINIFDMVELFNIDCVVKMAEYPDKYFDLAIVDPPYGIGIGTSVGGANHLLTLGSANLSIPKFIGDLMIRRPRKRNTSMN